jgi:hypothetical protein
LDPEKLERRGILEGYGDLPVLNNYRDVLAPVLSRNGASTGDLATIFPGFSLKPLLLFA